MSDKTPKTAYHQLSHTTDEPNTDSLLPNDTMPSSPMQPIKLPLDIHGHILLHIEFLQSLYCHFNGLLLHILGHYYEGIREDIQ
jgi:hypothetical protein